MKYLKLTILLAVVSGILLCFAGCDKDNSVKNPESTVLNNTPVVTEVPATDEPYETGFELHFIDVGQGDCMLLIADGEAMLIDSGNVGKGEGVVEYLKEQGVTKLKYLILTHGHADHVGGMPEVLDAFPFEQMFVYDKPVCEEEPYKNFMGIIGERSYEYVMPELGSKHSLGKGEFIVLGPSRLDNSNLNNNSISIKFTYGNRSFLLCGDAQAMQETDLIKFAKENNISLDCDVWKANHHGSLAGCSQGFINKAKAEFIVIQVGANNIYGYPGLATVNRLKNSGAVIYRNDVNGNIIVKTDGETLEWTTER